MITTLTQLRDAMLADDPSVLDRFGFWNSSDMPTFGGNEPRNLIEGVWSWDETSVLVGECADNLAIVPRAEWDEKPPHSKRIGATPRRLS